jgi:uncharacterized protein with GYD domain
MEGRMTEYLLLCNFTDQGIRGIKERPNRRAAARELGKKLGIEMKGAYLAMGPYDLIVQAEAKSEEAMATFVLSLASKGNLRTTTVRVFPDGEADAIIAAVV